MLLKRVPQNQSTMVLWIPCKFYGKNVKYHEVSFVANRLMFIVSKPLSHMIGPRSYALLMWRTMADLSTMAALRPVLLLSEHYGSNGSPDLATRGAGRPRQKSCEIIQ